MEIKKFSPTNHKVKALVYGPSGAWKTSFWGTAPNPIFASAEWGLLSIAHLNPDYVDIKTTKDLTELYTFLKTKPHDYETVIIDSITEINDLIKAWIERKNWRLMQLQDWWTLEKEITDILRKFRDLDMNVLFLALEKFEKDGEKIERIYPMLNGKAQTGIAWFMDIVWYISVDPSGNRKIITKSNPRTLSKARWVTLDDDDINFSSWVQKCREIPIWEETLIYNSDDDALREKEEKQRKLEDEQLAVFDELKEALIATKTMENLKAAYLNVEKAKAWKRISISLYDELVQIKDELKRTLMEELDPKKPAEAKKPTEPKKQPVQQKAPEPPKAPEPEVVDSPEDNNHQEIEEEPEDVEVTEPEKTPEPAPKSNEIKAIDNGWMDLYVDLTKKMFTCKTLDEVLGVIQEANTLVKEWRLATHLRDWILQVSETQKKSISIQK